MYNLKSSLNFQVSAGVTGIVMLNIVMGIASPHQMAATGSFANIFTNASVNILKQLTFINGVSKVVHSVLYTIAYSWSFCTQRVSNMSNYFVIVVAYTVYMVGEQFAKKLHLVSSVDEVRF